MSWLKEKNKRSYEEAQYRRAIYREIISAEYFFLKDYMFTFELKDGKLIRVKE
tara:strand:+ start:155 stop:313 length:159 start_codon:yes stop_codon:yes gene_type:complete